MESQLRPIERPHLEYIIYIQDRPSNNLPSVHKSSMGAFLIQDRKGIALFQDHSMLTRDARVAQYYVLARRTANRRGANLKIDAMSSCSVRITKYHGSHRKDPVR